jgi:hypothetical protein
MTTNTPTRRVVCAAIRNCKGQIICGPRHYDDIMRAQIHASRYPRYWKRTLKLFGITIRRYPRIEQGFVDQWGIYMTREEALVIAKLSNQIIRRCGHDNVELFSENLY